jgi:hypothetical protein
MFESTQEEPAGVLGAKRASQRKVNPRSLARRILDANTAAESPTKAEIARCRSLFWEAVEDDNEQLHAIVEYFLDNTLRSLLDEKAKPDPARLAEVKAKAAAATKTATEKVEIKVRDHIERKAQLILLDLVAPNGKRLGDCTGGDCKRFGGWYGALARAVPPGSKVGKVMSEQEVRKAWLASK